MTISMFLGLFQVSYSEAVLLQHTMKGSFRPSQNSSPTELRSLHSIIINNYRVAIIYMISYVDQNYRCIIL